MGRGNRFDCRTNGLSMISYFLVNSIDHMPKYLWWEKNSKMQKQLIQNLTWIENVCIRGRLIQERIPGRRRICRCRQRIGGRRCRRITRRRRRISARNRQHHDLPEQHEQDSGEDENLSFVESEKEHKSDEMTADPAFLQQIKIWTIPETELNAMHDRVKIKQKFPTSLKAT